MVRGIRIPGVGALLHGTCTGALFAMVAVPAGIPLMIPALVPVLAWHHGPDAVKALVLLVSWAVLLGVLGLADTTRRVLIGAGRRLLGVPLPPPAGRPRGANRWRTPLWVLLHTALGWATALPAGMLLLAGLVPVGVWLDLLGKPVSSERLVWFGLVVRVHQGWPGAWVWAVAAGCVSLALVVCAVSAAVLRLLAPRLLGPSAAERLAAAEQRELLLAGRNRLAQELHDSIGHTLTAATIQAAVAGELMSADPAAARAAMLGIEQSARTALDDLDYVLGVLRAEAAGTAPARGLADLPALLDRLRHTGVVVESELSGEWAQLPSTLSREAYRILQEGLTNALRHGGGGPIAVRVAAGRAELELTVVNSPSGTRGPSGRRERRGLIGLRERVRLLQGEVTAGPHGSQWRLAVRLPVRWSA
ncbi:histidine kinase [Kitasatospora paracochleata]|uniref:histidine kinase n=1 Tax=Kitasatospora paracochleata TaxID=58354 RepID=A0ABT1JAW2_9ACTN|nr:histidine kinase [Kitasatospora paracochleata]MCP2314580.1 signal transduction histidine kinase [Kitasatospora paracochleata]